MKLLKLSLVLILLAWVLALSEETIHPVEGPKSKPAKSKTQSQPPSPVPPKDSRPQQRHPSKTDEKAADDPRGTDKQPLVVKSLEAEKTAERIEQERQERDERAGYEGRLIFWTWVMAIATVCLFLVAGGQLGMFFFQLRLMRTYTKSGEQAAIAANSTAEHTRKEFLATHRPRMIVRRVELMMDDGNNPIGVRYTVHNIGNTQGTVIALSEQIWMPRRTEHLPVIPNYSPPKSVNISLGPGSRQLLEYIPPDALLNELQLLNVFKSGGEDPRYPGDRLFFLGYTEYADQLGMKRTTAFLREFEFDTKRFNPMSDPESEYQD